MLRTPVSTPKGRQNTILEGDTVKVSITTEGDFKEVKKWLTRSSTKVPNASLNTIGSKGVSALVAATPKRRGVTASGWDYKIKRTRQGADVIYFNNANPETRANVAMLIQTGHGTRNGGYVPPIDYINPALNGIFSNAGDLIAKEMFK